MKAPIGLEPWDAFPGCIDIRDFVRERRARLNSLEAKSLPHIIWSSAENFQFIDSNHSLNPIKHRKNLGKRLLFVSPLGCLSEQAADTRSFLTFKFGYTVGTLQRARLANPYCTLSLERRFFCLSLILGFLLSGRSNYYSPLAFYLVNEQGRLIRLSVSTANLR